MKNNIANNDIISVIVPVYKVEKYIHRCIDSIIHQTYENLEIILVDDGSPDNCGKICDDYAKLDNRIKVIHKENGGQSSARNAGLAAASGKFIAFVDSDDYIDNDMYEVLVKLICEYNADIVECECRAGKSNSFSVFGKNTRDIEIYSGVQALEKFYFGEQINGIASMVWDKLYKRELFDNIKFLDGYDRGEDANITPKLLLEANKIVKYNYNYYNYCIENPESSSLKITDKHFTDTIHLIEDLATFFETRGLTKYVEYTNIRLLNALYNFTIQFGTNSVVKNQIKNLNNILSNSIFYNTNLRIQFILYNISPYFFRIAMKIIRWLKKKLF